MSIGMNAKTGRQAERFSSLHESITKILTTPIGSRVMRRDFGSLLPDLVDYPATENNIILVYAATAGALIRHEPRLRLKRIRIDIKEQSFNQCTIEVTGVAYFNGLAVPSDLIIPIQAAGLDYA